MNLLKNCLYSFEKSFEGNGKITFKGKREIDNLTHGRVRYETEELYGILIKENDLMLEATNSLNGKKIKFYVYFWDEFKDEQEGYDHDYDQDLYNFEEFSGIEVEFSTQFAVEVFYSLLKYFNIDHKFKYDGSVNYGEFVLNLKDYLKILPYFKTAVREGIVSTHIHTSDPKLIYYINENIDFFSEWFNAFVEMGFFGRDFNNQYAYKNDCYKTYTYDRYQAITLPEIDDSGDYIRINDDESRVTIEFRVLKIVTPQIYNNFIDFLNIIQFKREKAEKIFRKKIDAKSNAKQYKKLRYNITAEIDIIDEVQEKESIIEDIKNILYDYLYDYYNTDELYEYSLETLRNTLDELEGCNTIGEVIDTLNNSFNINVEVNFN